MRETAGTLEAVEVPFDAGRLDRLMDDAGLDVLLACSRTTSLAARRLPVPVLLGDGRDRAQPLPADRRLRQGAAGRRRLCRLPDGKGRARQPAVLDPGLRAGGLGDARCHGRGGRPGRADRRGARADRHRARLPAGGCLAVAARAAAGRAAGRCDRGARAGAGAEDAGGARRAAARLGADHRRDAGDDRRGGRGRDQAHDHRSTAARGDGARARVRLLPDHAGTSLNRAPSDQAWRRGEILSLELGRQLAGLDRRPLPHGGSSARRTRSSRTCSPRSTRRSGRPSARCGRAPSAAR